MPGAEKSSLARFLSGKYSLDRGFLGLKCYCGFSCDTERELKDHILKTHGARDGDWKGWVSR